MRNQTIVTVKDRLGGMITTLRLKITGIGMFKIRIKIALWFFRIGCWVVRSELIYKEDITK